MRGLERDQVTQTSRLIGIKKFEGERQNFIFNTFVDFKTVKRFENGSDMSEFSGLDNSTSKRVLNQLQSIYLGLWKVIIQKIMVVSFGVYNGSCDKTDCF